MYTKTFEKKQIYKINVLKHRKKMPIAILLHKIIENDN